MPPTLLAFALPIAPLIWPLRATNHANPSQLHYPQSPSPHSIATRVSHELEFADSVEKQRSNSLWGRPFSPGRNRNRLLICCSSSPRTPKLVLGILIIYTGGFFFGFVLFGFCPFSWSIACLVSVFVRFWVKFWGCVLLSFFEAVRSCGGLMTLAVGGVIDFLVIHMW